MSNKPYIQNQTDDFYADEFNSEEGNLFSNLLETYLPFWPWFLISVLLCLAGANTYLRYANPDYEVNAKILVKDEKKGVDASKVLDALNVFGENKIVENEIEIIHSTPLLEKVVKDLNLYVTQTHLGNVRDIEYYGKSAPLLIYAEKEDSVIALKSPMPFSIDWKNKKIMLGKKRISDNSRIRLNGQSFRIALNSAYKPKGEETFQLFIQPVHQVATSLKSNLTVEASSKQSTVINLRLETVVPRKGEDIINTLFTVYDHEALNDKNILAKNTLNFVERRLGLMSKDLAEVEEKLKDYKSSQGIVDISEQGKLYLETVQENDQRLSEINVQLSVLSDVEKYVNSKTDNKKIVPSLLGINDATLVGLLNKLYEAEIQLVKVLRVSGAQSDQVYLLKEEIAHLKPDILEIISNIRKNYVTSQKKIEGRISENKELLSTIPGKEKALIDISRQQMIKNNIYSFLLQKREETALSYSSAAADSRVIEPAVAGVNPIRPKSNMIYLIGLALGLGLVVFVIMLMDSLTGAVMFRKDIEKSVTVPIIAELILGKRNSPIVVSDGNRTLLAEQFRMLRTNLAYFGLTKDKNIIQVCSSISGEGKSFVASNLAITYSLTGKKVLLLELDLRKPKQSTYFKLASKKGLTNYLTNTASLGEIMQQVEGIPHLSIISSGPIPPNPTELLSGTAFAEFISQVRGQFDYIIADLPPVSVVTDAQIFAPFAQATLYVVRHAKTPKSYLKLIQQKVQLNHFNQLQIVFNGIKPRGVIPYGDGYGYGNGYGYGYHEGEKKSNWFKRLLGKS
jgi:tyrosine-protein kinase Etk/Wzc